MEISEQTTIWRYMDLPKFVAMLASESLWFAKARCLDDPYEGFCHVQCSDILSDDAGPEWATRRDSEGNTEMSLTRMMAEMSRIAAGHLRNAPDHVYVNSWCLGSESMAMWEIYGCSGQGIAIKSSVAQYKRAAKFGDIERQQYDFGPVQYHQDLPGCQDLQLDVRQSIPLGPSIWRESLKVAFYKRVCFEHEREWRGALYQDARSDCDGCDVAFNLNELLSAIIVGPRAPNFFATVVREVMHRFNLETRLEVSSLLRSPEVPVTTIG